MMKAIYRKYKKSSNKRITPKERNLLKGAVRRVFSRSELRREVLETTRINHSDPTRPRVKKWSKCQLCDTIVPTYTIEIDHIAPVIPITTTLENMNWDEVIDRIWCDRVGLQGICQPCHRSKTKLEIAERKRRRKEENGQTSKPQGIEKSIKKCG